MTINIAQLVLVIAFLESSNGRNLNHQDPHCHGHTGISDAVIHDLNQRAGYEKYKVADMDDRYNCLMASQEHLEHYLSHNPDATVNDLLLVWRCGEFGSRHPEPKHLEYMRAGLDRFIKLQEGDERWNK